MEITTKTDSNKSTHKKLIEALLCSDQLFQSHGVTDEDLDKNAPIDPILTHSQITKAQENLAQLVIELKESKERLEKKKLEPVSGINIPPFIKKRYQKEFSTKAPEEYDDVDKAEFQKFVDKKIQEGNIKSIQLLSDEITDMEGSIAKLNSKLATTARVRSQNIGSDILVRKLFILIKSYFSAIVTLPHFDIIVPDNFSGISKFSDIRVEQNVFVINNYPYKLSDLEMIQKQLCDNKDTLSELAAKLYPIESIQKRIVKYTKASQI